MNTLPFSRLHRTWRTTALTCLICTGMGLTTPSEARAEASKPAPLLPIASLDVARYMGVWYEIAKYPNWFQRKCASNTHATYRILSSAHVEVVNRCRKADGEPLEAVGLARQLGAADSARLEVRFAPAWMAWVPLVWGDYWVIDLDEAYQLVAVSEPKRNYLWILSRSPQVEPAAYQALLARLANKGFDLSKLETSLQQP